MEANPKFAKLASDVVLAKTIKALDTNGITTTVVENGEEAKKRVFELIPEGAEVYNTTSETLTEIGVAKEITENGKYDSVRNKIMAMDRETQKHEMKKLGDTPMYVVGSVHAVTEDGKVLIASNSGSQIPSYVYGADQVVWVVSSKKIVKDLDEGMKRIYEYSLQLENVRVQAAYGMPQSNVRKILIFNNEMPGRIHMIIVKEDLGY